MSPSPQPLVWYLAREGQQFGPIPDPDLMAMLRLGKIAPTDHLWNDQLANWTPAAVVFPTPEAQPITTPPPPVIAAVVAEPATNPTPSGNTPLFRHAAVAGIIATLIAAVALAFQLNLFEGPSTSDLRKVILFHYKDQLEVPQRMAPGSPAARSAQQAWDRLNIASFSKESCDKSVKKNGYYCVVRIDFGGGKAVRIKNTFNKEGSAWVLADWTGLWVEDVQ